MRLAFELSMEHPTLPRADALAALESEGVHVRGVSFSPEILVVDSLRPPRRAYERVSLSRCVDRVLAIGPWPAIVRAAARIDLGGESFRVRAHGPFSPEEKRDLERFLLCLLGRFLYFALILSGTPQNSCRFDLIY